MKRQPTEWEKIPANDTSDKRLTFKVYKEFIQLNKKTNNSIFKKWVEDLNRPFSKDKMLKVINLREMQIKITMKYHLTPARMAVINKSKNNKY